MSRSSAPGCPRDASATPRSSGGAPTCAAEVAGRPPTCAGEPVADAPMCAAERLTGPAARDEPRPIGLGQERPAAQAWSKGIRQRTSDRPNSRRRPSSRRAAGGTTSVVSRFVGIVRREGIDIRPEHRGLLLPWPEMSTRVSEISGGARGGSRRGGPTGEAAGAGRRRGTLRRPAGDTGRRGGRSTMRSHSPSTRAMSFVIVEIFRAVPDRPSARSTAGQRRLSATPRAHQR